MPELAEWIGEIKGHQVKVVQKTDRIVPLAHFLYNPLTGGRHYRASEGLGEKAPGGGGGQPAREEVKTLYAY